MSKGLTKVRFTNIDKILYPQHKITKAQVIKYYIKQAPKMLAYLARKSLSLNRFPDGIDTDGIYEKDSPKGTPNMRALKADKDLLDCIIDQIEDNRLREYTSKRDFQITPEPQRGEKTEEGLIFVVHEHHAKKLHYDLRLEKEGVLKSWAVPKGIPVKPAEKRLAIMTEDHPLGYSDFEGTIPTGQYGAGTVKIWDKGPYTIKIWDDDKIDFFLIGERVKGRYVLTRFKKAGEKEWLLLKVRD